MHETRENKGSLIKKKNIIFKKWMNEATDQLVFAAEQINK